MSIPKSVPAKYRYYIKHWDDERASGGNIFVTLIGLTVDEGVPCHCFGEATIKDAIKVLSECSPCSCHRCQTMIPSNR